VKGGNSNHRHILVVFSCPIYWYSFSFRRYPRESGVDSIGIVHHHHQRINAPTAGAQAFLKDYPQGQRAITYHAGPVRIGG
jgi:hypothetical protein